MAINSIVTRINEQSFNDLLRSLSVLLEMAESVSERSVYFPTRDELETLVDLGWSWENPVGINDLVSGLESRARSIMKEHGLSIVEDKEPTTLETEWLVEHEYLEQHKDRVYSTFNKAEAVFKVAEVSSHMGSALLRLFVEDERMDALYEHWYE